MLHTPSYNCGLFAGLTAKALGHPAPQGISDVPGITDIFAATEDRFFFPLSYYEGFFSAYAETPRKYIALVNDPKFAFEAD